MSDEQPVPERFQSALRAVIRMIADDDVAALRAGAVIRVDHGDPLLWARDYPGTIIPLPAEGWNFADAIQVSGHPGEWSIVIPLWTDVEGRSDLTLEATVEDREQDPLVRIDNIHVR